jgi:hypothetical protein
VVRWRRVEEQRNVTESSESDKSEFFLRFDQLRHSISILNLFGELSEKSRIIGNYPRRSWRADADEARDGERQQCILMGHHRLS